MMEATPTFKHIHFVGIGGIGMSAIAGVLIDRGYQVSGSDIAESEIVLSLREKGAEIFLGHQGEQIADTVDVVVRSTAIRENNPEIQSALEKNIPVWHRSQMLGYLMKGSKAICIAGSHGKTTTSSMIALVMELLKKEPTFVVGGVINEVGTNAKNGESDWFVAEADESDGSLINLHPWFSVVTNIDEDHLEHFKDIEEIKGIFKEFVCKNHPEGKVLLCADDPEALSLLDYAQGEVLTYGEKEGSDYHIRNRRQEGKLNKADIYFRDEFLGTLSLQLPGKHYIANATAAVAACMTTGLAFQDIVEVLQIFKGTRRRFQLAGEVRGITVIDDYAHHPNEIRATIEAAKDYHNGRVVAVFQPHRYTRTRYLAGAFAEALSEADKVYLLDVYPADEDPIPGVSSHLIADHVACRDKTEIVEEGQLPILLKSVLREGDLVLIMGAGSIWKEAPKVVKALQEQ